MDAIVVETEAIAFEITQFLSSNRAMLRETILPLDALDRSALEAALLDIGRS